MWMLKIDLQEYISLESVRACIKDISSYYSTQQSIMPFNSCSNNCYASDL